MLLAAYKWTLPMRILGEVCWDLEVCRCVGEKSEYRRRCVGVEEGMCVGVEEGMCVGGGV